MWVPCPICLPEIGQFTVVDKSVGYPIYRTPPNLYTEKEEKFQGELWMVGVLMFLLLLTLRLILPVALLLLLGTVLRRLPVQ
jgi:hypothetical protein